MRASAGLAGWFELYCLAVTPAPEEGLIGSASAARETMTVTVSGVSGRREERP